MSSFNSAFAKLDLNYLLDFLPFDIYLYVCHILHIVGSAENSKATQGFFVVLILEGVEIFRKSSGILVVSWMPALKLYRASWSQARQFHLSSCLYMFFAIR